VKFTAYRWQGLPVGQRRSV